MLPGSSSVTTVLPPSAGLIVIVVRRSTLAAMASLPYTTECSPWRMILPGADTVTASSSFIVRGVEQEALRQAALASGPHAPQHRTGAALAVEHTLCGERAASAKSYRKGLQEGEAAVDGLFVRPAVRANVVFWVR